MSADSAEFGDAIAAVEFPGELGGLMEEGGADDPAFLAAALGDVARARNMSQLARDTGLTREGLYKALSGKGNPTLDTVMKIAKALGLRLTFKPA